MQMWADWQMLCTAFGEWLLRRLPWMRGPAERTVEWLYRVEQRVGRRWLWVTGLWVALVLVALPWLWGLNGTWR